MTIATSAAIDAVRTVATDVASATEHVEPFPAELIGTKLGSMTIQHPLLKLLHRSGSTFPLSVTGDGWLPNMGHLPGVTSVDQAIEAVRGIRAAAPPVSPTDDLVVEVGGNWFWGHATNRLPVAEFGEDSMGGARSRFEHIDSLATGSALGVDLPFLWGSRPISDITVRSDNPAFRAIVGDEFAARVVPGRVAHRFKMQ